MGNEEQVRDRYTIFDGGDIGRFFKFKKINWLEHVGPNGSRQATKENPVWYGESGKSDTDRKIEKAMTADLAKIRIRNSLEGSERSEWWRVVEEPKILVC